MRTIRVLHINFCSFCLLFVILGCCVLVQNCFLLIYVGLTMFITRALFYFVKHKRIPGRLDIGYCSCCNDKKAYSFYAKTGLTLTAWTYTGHTTLYDFYQDVTTLRSGGPSVCLSVCNVGAPYLGSWSFWQYFFTAVYLGHALTSVQDFTELVPGHFKFGG